VRKLTLSLAILAAMMPGRGYPLGLGEIELNSALNQELDAEIEVLSAQPEDVEQLIIKLASREAFARAGIDRPFLLQQLKFKLIVKDGRSFVTIRTQKPVREPFLSFLVDIDWPQGRLLREYTLLLDPPVYSGGGRAVSASSAGGNERPFIDPAEQANNQSANSITDAITDAASSVSAFDPASRAHSGGAVAAEAGGSTAYTATTQPTQLSGQYRVRANDTLWSLSNRMKPDSSVSVEQMMLALVRKNPEAFIQQNVHGLKRGYILRMPDRALINSLDRQQALAQAREHSVLWRQYRQAQSGAAPASSLAAEFDEVATETATDTSKIDAQLSIVSASATDGGDVASAGQHPDANEIKRLRNELALAREALESERLAKDDLHARLSGLEQRLQNVLQMEESELAQLQQDLQVSVEEAEKPVEAVVAEEVGADAALIEDTVTEALVEEVTDDAAVGEASAEESTHKALFVDEVNAVEDTLLSEQAATTVTAEPVDAPAFVQSTKPKSFIEKLLDDPSMLAAIGGGLLGVFALLGILLRRRRVNKNADEWEASADADDLGDLDYLDKASANSKDTAATVKSKTVDMAATGEMEAAKDLVVDFEDTQIEAPAEDDMEDALISLEDEPAEVSSLEESDDVLAEADVYLAYGIYQQAEELLSSAIEQNPERDDYRMKLLETHFAGKNSGAFASLAAEVQQRKAGDKSYWDRVVVMGRDLCPGNSLFTASGVIVDLNADDLLPEKPQAPDLDLDASASAADDLDLALDEESPDLETDATQILPAPVDAGIEPIKDSAAAEADEVGDLLDDSELEFDLGDFGEELEQSDDSNADALVDALDDAPAEASDEIAAKKESADPVLELDDALDSSLDENTAISADLDIDEDFSLDFEASDLGFDEEDERADADLSLDTDTGAATEETSAPEIAMDVDTAEETQDVALAEDENEFDISSLSDDLDEVSTKLDLAKAYIDMGDLEGAKSILEEVKQEGSDEQQQQANDLLKQAS
jgi:pilus assembly protein FimV